MKSAAGTGRDTNDRDEIELPATMPCQSSTRSIAIAGLSMVYEDHDRVSARRVPLLLLHGAVQSRRVWSAQADAFAGGRRVIAPDLRGHGDTRGEAADLSLGRHADDMIALLDALALPKVVVCGVSLGGMVALEMVARAPDRITGVVLADTPLALSMTGLVRGLIETLGPQRILWPFFTLLGRRRTGRLGLAMARLIFGKKWVGKAAGDLFVEGFSTMSREAIVETYAAIVAADPVALDIADRPCLVIVGRYETTLVVSHAGEIARRLGRTEIVSVEGGHVPNVDAPEEFNAAVMRFLEKSV
ncbi:alpha/beta hydrolase [Fulvimarina sp. 2208YS6-2-32]|uniref:Alpha/beta hydrolase n=1 Tax=Fulvimarina uroteuthidis TaxID=3098149 RepID=A0ABU5I634_9HYPH|nr:alpha/beta hydrolase [Fulvimarina sp. 2208YS6-2-32]MDY8110848.1 alpha/beta hydrolase [Fulvimarina sp. 2208YS6-2-32]